MSPLITVALAAIFLKERVRIYRWSAVVVGFAGVIVMLWPHLDLARYTSAATSAATLGALFALAGAFTNAASVVQTRRLTDTETTSSIVLYFSLFCTVGGLLTLPFGWIVPTGPQLAALVALGMIGGLLAHPADRELSLRAGLAGRAARLHGAALGVHHRLSGASARCRPRPSIIGSPIVAGAGLFVIWRERQLGLERARAAAGPPTDERSDLSAVILGADAEAARRRIQTP